MKVYTYAEVYPITALGDSQELQLNVTITWRKRQELLLSAANRHSL